MAYDFNGSLEKIVRYAKYEMLAQTLFIVCFGAIFGAIFGSYDSGWRLLVGIVAFFPGVVSFVLFDRFTVKRVQLVRAHEQALREDASVAS